MPTENPSNISKAKDSRLDITLHTHHVQVFWSRSLSANKNIRYTFDYFQIIQRNSHEQLVFVCFQCTSNTTRTTPRRKVWKWVSI